MAMGHVAVLRIARLRGCILILLVEDSSSTFTNRCKHFGVGRNGRASGGYRCSGAPQDTCISPSGFPRMMVHLRQDAGDLSPKPSMTE
jgi:hypothetical protein